ncbi:hypothetical protein MPLB_1770008 [Mesorhizobium sp. ORS 3324]|nr:hypothetical protein MPLB_1770008 [Mesorhizobium sp. ORS 3324]
MNRTVRYDRTRDGFDGEWEHSTLVSPALPCRLIDTIDCLQLSVGAAGCAREGPALPGWRRHS